MVKRCFVLCLIIALCLAMAACSSDNSIQETVTPEPSPITEATI